MIEIDGGYLSGGGQILRTALALSAVTKQPAKIYNIRRGRRQGGLMWQHLEGLNAISKLCGAKVIGGRIGSTEVEFHPGEIKNKTLEINIGTAGGTMLIFQTLQIPAALAGGPVEIKIDGGATYAEWAPPAAYTQNVFLPLMKRLGYNAEMEVLRNGFYPKGGAKLKIVVQPSSTFKSIYSIEPGEIKKVRGISIASSSLKEKRVAERQAESAEEHLKGARADIGIEYAGASNPGSGIVLWAESERSILGSDDIGEIKKKAEDVGRDAAKDLIASIKSGATLDKYMSDQILPFLALAKGRSEVRVEELTDHCLTNMWVIEKFLPVKFDVDKEKRIISCIGSGFDKK